MKLREYFNKNIKVTFTDGEIREGYVEVYTPAIDSEEELEEIAIREKGISTGLVLIMEDEIETIEIIK